MNTETLTLKNGYKIVIAQDESAENPWSAWDGEPPIAVFNGDRHSRSIETYETDLSLRVIFDLLPLSAFEKDVHAILSALDLDADDVPFVDYHGKPSGWKDAIGDALPDSPTTWREADEYFDKCAALCKLAGIAYYNGQSDGYSQGDSALVFVAALPSWAATVGAPAETLHGQCKNAFDLWSAWAWGDVYGIQSILRPDTEDEDGEEIADGSVWGFYGGDHKVSGLLESAESSVAWDIKQQAKEKAESFRAACADIVTV